MQWNVTSLHLQGHTNQQSLGFFTLINKIWNLVDILVFIVCGLQGVFEEYFSLPQPFLYKKSSLVQSTTNLVDFGHMIAYGCMK
jgi:hypothetical protein